MRLRTDRSATKPFYSIYDQAVNHSRMSGQRPASPPAPVAFLALSRPGKWRPRLKTEKGDGQAHHMHTMQYACDGPARMTDRCDVTE